MMEKKNGSSLLVCFFLLAPVALNALIGFHETQLTIEPWHLEAGFGQCRMQQPYYYNFGNGLRYENLHISDLWFKTGIKPGLDVGVGFDPMGARLDMNLKHSLYKDYVSLSYELQAGLWYETIGRDFALQVSLLSGYPGKVVVPYAILRQRFLFIDADGLEIGPSMLFSAGLSFKLLRVSRLYFELGTCMGEFQPTPRFLPHPDVISSFVGAGASIDFDIKEILEPLLK